ncbi:MAG: hypothetical protein B6244_03570 [Candidatus Cloacimonetes bacterium 4572_55]|nr:MAG: hypothetical protein B6244_03570 [Candidatus Cloacimonetes bacterium 4572_55]
MRKKFISCLILFALFAFIFQGCTKGPPPPPIGADEVDGAYREAMEAKENLESLEKERDMLNADLKEKQEKLDRAKECAEEEGD